ncbi:ABC1 kinase family protein [Bacillus sp. USDA818B3_A]|uniref:ABC1 kinase family protein n=1 Tax=Bacillus sp. USDA818B3_A TaxID=2698834 RepID=UPI00136C2D2C|nr:AarF/UbiB family protein [Bacillus sp. USDA818B3_A]
MKTKNKLYRIYRVLSMAFIIFLQIYWYKLRRKPKEDWENLWGKIGERFRNTLFELEGLLIKIGQILSTRADLLPNAFIGQIEDLTDKVPPSSWIEIQSILEKEWGKSIEEAFLSIEKSAVASASIGEVYKGVLKNGTEVAIKVKRPNIDSIVKIDFRILGFIIWCADHFVPIPKGFINFRVLYKELKQVIEQELNYTKELDTILYFRNRFKSKDIVQIPSVYTEFCTSSVLVMEWVEGIRITELEELEQLLITRKEIAQRLIEVFLTQWLEPGIFHADPHPGNILISKEGRIVLLDFGMVGELTKKDAANIQDLIQSFLTKDYSKVVDCLFHLGFLLPEADSKIIEKLITEMVSFDPTQVKEMNLMAFKMELNELIQSLPIQVPTRFVFLGRSFITIEGIIRQLAPEEELMELGKPVFINWIHTQGNSKWTFVWKWIQSLPTFKFLYSIRGFLDFPQKLEQMKENEQRRQFQFNIYENNKKFFFQLFVLGLIGIGIGIYTSQEFILYLTIGVTSASVTGYFINYQKLKRWMKYMHEKRRE